MRFDPSMSSIKYPASLYCPSCKAAIKLDYEGQLRRRWSDYATTNDLLVMQMVLPYSRLSAKYARSNKQDVEAVIPRVLICQHCFTILGIYDKD